MTELAAVTEHSTDVATDTNQFLTFRLEDEEYGIEILKVQEIKGYSAITPIPNTPAHVKGVLNLRGAVVPIVDLRLKFGMQEHEYDRFTVIIVVTVATKIVGLVVDAVSDVLNFGGEDVQPAPDLGADVDVSFLKGVARSAEHLVALLDIDKVVGHEANVAVVSDSGV